MTLNYNDMNILNIHTLIYFKNTTKKTQFVEENILLLSQSGYQHYWKVNSFVCPQ